MSKRAPASMLETQSRQHLPVPLGGTRPVHIRVRTRRVLRHWKSIAVSLGFVSGGLGAWLTATTPDVAVYQDGRGVHVGSLALTAQPAAPAGAAVFAGGGAVIVVMPQRGNVVIATGIAFVDGQRSAARCALQRGDGRASEQCSISWRGRRLSASDLFDPVTSSWLRRYADGTTARIDVPRGAQLLAVPFPVGAPSS